MSTYQRALLNIDFATEKALQKEQLRKAQEERQKQEEKKTLGGFIGKGLGFLAAGPAGMAIGSAIGKGIADLSDDAEDFKVTPGIFNVSATEDINLSLDEFDDASNLATLIDFGSDLFTAGKLSGFLGKDGIDFSKSLTKTRIGDDYLTSSEVIKKFLPGDASDLAEEVTDTVTDKVIGKSNAMPSSRDYGLFQINDYTWNDSAQTLFGKDVKDLSITEHLSLVDFILKTDNRDDNLTNWATYGGQRYKDYLNQLSETTDVKATFDSIAANVGSDIDNSVYSQVEMIAKNNNIDVRKLLAIGLAESLFKTDAIGYNQVPLSAL